jgi:hypothetical protein
VAVAALVAAGLVFVFRPDPAGDLLDDLRRQGYEINVGFAGHYRPGTVIRVERPGPEGVPEALPRPEVALWPDQCFPESTPRTAPLPLPRRTGHRALRLDAEAVHRVLPRLGIQGAKRWEMEIVRPRLATFSVLGELSEQYSDFCLDRLERALDGGHRLSWYRTITEAVVAEGLRIDVEWRAGTAGETRTAARRAVEESLAGAEVAAAFESQERTVLEVDGDVVLAYRTAVMEAVTDGAEAGGDG